MCYIEICNKKDRSPGLFRRQIKLKNVEFGSRFHRRQSECVKIKFGFFKFKRIRLVYHIIDFLQKLIFYATRYVDEHEAKKSLTTRLVFHVALDEQVQVGIHLHNFQRHLLMTLVSLTGDVVRHTRTVLIRQTGDDDKDFMWNEHRLLFRLW